MKVTGSGPGTVRTAGSITDLSGPSWREGFEGDALKLIGDWHTHRNDLGPSPNDIDNAWTRELERIQPQYRDRWVALIATAEGGDWTKPELEAFIVRHEDRRGREAFDVVDGRVVCERAQAQL